VKRIVRKFNESDADRDGAPDVIERQIGIHDERNHHIHIKTAGSLSSGPGGATIPFHGNLIPKIRKTGNSLRMPAPKKMRLDVDMGGQMEHKKMKLSIEMKQPNLNLGENKKKSSQVPPPHKYRMDHTKINDIVKKLSHSGVKNKKANPITPLPKKHGYVDFDDSWVSRITGKKTGVVSG
jgi:hypothetical protein